MVIDYNSYLIIKIVKYIITAIDYTCTDIKNYDIYYILEVLRMLTIQGQVLVNVMFLRYNISEFNTVS